MRSVPQAKIASNMEVVQVLTGSKYSHVTRPSIEDAAKPWPLGKQRTDLIWYFKIWLRRMQRHILKRFANSRVVGLHRNKMSKRRRTIFSGPWGKEGFDSLSVFRQIHISPITNVVDVRLRAFVPSDPRYIQEITCSHTSCILEP